MPGSWARRTGSDAGRGASSSSAFTPADGVAASDDVLRGFFGR